MTVQSRVRGFNDSIQPGIYIRLSDGTTGFVFDKYNTGILFSALMLERNAWMSKERTSVDVLVVETGKTRTICASDIRATCTVRGVAEDSDTPRAPLLESLKTLRWVRWDE